MLSSHRHLAWHHFRFDVPSTWETVKYRTRADDGMMVLCDRHGVTMQIYWLKVKDKPVVERRLTELVKENLAERNQPCTEDEIRKAVQDMHGWKIYRPLSGSIPVFAGRFLEQQKILLNVTLPQHKKHEPRQFIEPVLGSYQPNNGEILHWGIGGLEFCLPREYKIDQIELLPSMQRIFMETKKGYRTVLYRYAMMSRHLRQQSLTEFFARMTGRKKELFFKGNILQEGRYEGVELKYYTRGSGNILTNLISRPWEGRILLWCSPEHERIYAVENHARVGFEIENLEECLQTT